MPSSASLHLLHGPRSWPLGIRPLTIGREPECDITIPGDQVSRKHAYVVPTPTGPLLIDGSRLGTTVNPWNHGQWGACDLRALRGSVVSLDTGDGLDPGAQAVPARVARPIARSHHGATEPHGKNHGEEQKVLEARGSA